MPLYIGTSGFSYSDWVGRFYPKTIKRTEWLEYYSKYFNTTELNVTFYRMPFEAVFRSWCGKTPADFIFSVKGSRFITHIKRLNNVESAVDYFFSRVSLLEEKLGPVLWQLPPNLKPDIRIVSKFLKLLEKYKHSFNVFEFRNAAWLNAEIISLIKDTGGTICISDWTGFRTDFIKGFDFYYIRRHGAANASLYSGRYTDKEIIKDADMIKSKMDNKKVFIYYNNDVSCNAVKNARTMKEYLA